MIFTALALAAAPVVKPPEYVMIYGPQPTPSCGKWISVRKDSDGLPAHEYEMWVLGLISGMNMRSSSAQARGPDTDALFVWIDQYCAAHPLDLLLTAADKLDHELEGRTH